jgi:hypothetical protein
MRGKTEIRTRNEIRFNIEDSGEMLALEADRRTSEESSMNLEQCLAVGRGRDDTVDPRFGGHVVGEGQKDWDDRGKVGGEAQQGQVMRGF